MTASKDHQRQRHNYLRMSSAKCLSYEGEADGLHTVIESGSSKYLCFTSCTSHDWIIHVTDGIDVWRLVLNLTNLESNKDLAEVNTYEAYFSRFRHAFKIGDVTVSKQKDHKVIGLSVGTSTTALWYDLYEATASERRTDLQRAIFFFAETCSGLTQKLTAKEEELSALKKQRSNMSDSVNLPDLEFKRHMGSQAKVVKQQGLSIVNPSSKKRKAAKGVEFD